MVHTMTSRDKIFGRVAGSPTTFVNDILAPNLPLPDLSTTLERYYESLQPFASTSELIDSKQKIEEFDRGIGRTLQEFLEDRSKNNKNWLEEWWDKYTYCTDRTGILPLRAMGAVISTGFIKLDISSAYRLKATARLIHSTLEYFELLRNECLKQDSYGSVQFSMNQYRRLFNSLRIPGLQFDVIKSYFETVSEGEAPRNIILILRGRIFSVEFFDRGNIMSAPLILKILEEIFLLVGSSAPGISIPVLSCDNRSAWAANRMHLQNLSPKNRKFLELIEKSIMIVSFDEHSPRSWEETALHTLCGDVDSKWADKSLALVSFKNGKFGYIGEHGCYDGTILNSLRKFHVLSMLEYPEPDWNDCSFLMAKSNLMEITFDVDDRLESESRRLIPCLKEMQTSVIFLTILFHGYGSKFIKEKMLYPDGYLQMIIQLAYYKMHLEYPSTYETALLRKFYNGRTETVRSCTLHSVNWIFSFLNATHSDTEKFKNLKKAVDDHKRIMNIARSGNGIDRHLFGLRCASFEMNLEIPDLFKDPLYRKSGGDGNFVLSTSTTGHSTLLRSGFVAPMIRDGYGVFYSHTDDSIWFQVTAYRKSNKTNAHKFEAVLKDTLLEVKRMIDLSNLASKL